MPTPLSIDEITTALEELSGWAGGTEQIARTVIAPDFPTAITIVDEVAVVAEALDHHPDIDIRWREVTFTLSTHSEGGVTALDVDLARRIDAVAVEHAP